ncbi:MAG TPA: hypothetical protein DD435_11510 [Cyanobacteria bacterium UBA8530]|nr:hypothetical protein [Cyanobacteria bacterium UBA8530]
MDQNVRGKEVQTNTEVSPDIRRSLIMARGMPEVEERAARPLYEKLEPFGTDLMHWSSIWAGFFLYFAVASILGAVVIAAGGIPVGAPASTVGAVTAVIMVLSLFISAFLAGWTSNLRSLGPVLVNGAVLASLIIAIPLLGSIGFAAFTAATTPGPIDFTPTTLSVIRANLAMFSFGSILLLAAGMLGYWAGLKAHLGNLGLLKSQQERVR